MSETYRFVEKNYSNEKDVMSCFGKILLKNNVLELELTGIYKTDRYFLE